MSSIIFNGVNSSDLDLIIIQPVIRPTWGEEYEEIASGGAVRKLVKKSRTFANTSFSVRMAIVDAVPKKIRAIYQAFQGFGKLILSGSPDEVMDAVLSPLLPEAVALEAAEFSLNITDLPFAYALEPTIIDITKATDFVEVPNNGTIFSQPEITFKKSAAEDTVINVNGQEFTINANGLKEAVSGGFEVTIDCDLEIAYYTAAGGEKLSITPYTAGDFPLLHEGLNYVRHSGSMTSAQINVKERYR